MDLTFSDEQLALRGLVRSLCEDAGGRDAVRRLEQDPAGFDPDFWARLGEAGVAGLTLGEEYGGSGLSVLDAVVVFEKLGSSLVPSPLLASSAVAAEAIRLCGTPEQRDRWVPRLAAAETVVVPAWLEPDGGYAESGVQLPAARVGDQWTLSGTKWLVPFASSAEALVVLARREGQVALFLVETAQAGVRVEPQETIAREAYAKVVLDAAVGVPLGDPAGSWDRWSEVVRRAAVLVAAQATGGAREVLRIAVEHAQTRHQFGKPLGAFQSLAHYMADALATVDAAQALVWQAAWALDEGRPSAEQLAPMAKLGACDTFRDVSATALQICGGLGFTTDFDAQLYFRRAKQWQLTWWDSAHLEEQIAIGALGPAT